MSNKETPHVHVLPEDRANRELALGFETQLSTGKRAFKVLPVANGWPKVRSQFEIDHIAELRRYKKRFLVLLIDFDSEEKRFAHFAKVIPDDLSDRVFVIGVWNEAEDLSNAFKKRRDKIGEQLAIECRDGTAATWEHELLRHNKGELDRMMATLRPVLFP